MRRGNVLWGQIPDVGDEGTKSFKIITPLLGIEIVAFAAFWILVFTGAVAEFETLVFFEPIFTYTLIGMAILTGMIIGGVIERHQHYLERKCEVKK